MRLSIRHFSNAEINLFFSPSLAMKIFIHFAQLSVSNMSVNLRGGNTGMA